MAQRRFLIILLAVIILPLTISAQGSAKLTGTVIGTELSVDYNTGDPSETVNSRNNAFDGDLSTFFASYERSLTWCGLDLGTKHVITRVAWSPRDDINGPNRVILAIFEGANEPDFSDAVPLYLNDTEGTIGEFQYADVSVSRAFRYVRYVGPHDARCNIAEVEFYGYESEGEEGQFYHPTNLPLVVVHVENNAEPTDKVNLWDCTITLIPSDANDTIKTTTGNIRLRGNASMGFPKKPYRIKFDKKHHVFGSSASAKKWTLINNYGDKTLLRNILAFEISRRIGMTYTPYCQPVDVMVNGEYKGCYQLCDQVEVGKNRIDVEKMKATDTAGDALTGGYHIEVDDYATREEGYFISGKGNPVGIKYPASDAIVAEQREYIINQFDSLETSLFGDNFMSATGYRTRLDVESFLKRFIVSEFTCNTDAFWSTHMYKYRGDEHIYVGPVWDFDLAFENDSRLYPCTAHSDYLYTYGGNAGNMKDFIDRIIVDDTRTEGELLAIWANARLNRGLTLDSLLAYVDATADLLYASQRLNFIRWPILNTLVHQNWQAAGSYEGEVEIVKTFLAESFEWFDNKLGFDASGIKEVESSRTDMLGTDIIYTLDGRSMGTKADSLPKGTYIRN